MNRKVTVSICLFILLSCFSVDAWAGEVIWGPKKYIRDTGKPVPVVEHFGIDKPAGKFYLYVSNGGSVRKPGEKPFREPVDQISSAVIKFNSVEVVGPQDFNQQVLNITKEDITLSPNNTIEVEVRGKPGSYITAEIRKANLNETVSNEQGSMNGTNMQDMIHLTWGYTEGASEYVIYKAYSSDGPWTEWTRFSGEQHKNAVDGTPEAETMDLCYKIEALDSKGKVIRRYEPICVPKWQKEESSLPLSKKTLLRNAVAQNQYQEKKGQGNSDLPFPLLAFLPIPSDIIFPLFSKPPSFQLASAETTIVSTSNQNSQPAYNGMCLSNDEFINKSTMSYADIKKLLKDKGSFLQGDEVKDVDGTFFDPAELIDFAAQVYGINPQVILAVLQREHSAITTTTKNRPDDSILRHIMEYGKPTTISDQIMDGTAQMRRDFDRLSNGQSTAGGWKVGVGKNAIDGKKLLVTPANKAVAVSFSYDPEVGYGWDKTSTAGGNFVFCKVWEKWGFGVKCKPEDVLTITGSDTTTRNSTKQYTATGCGQIEWSVLPLNKGATINKTSGLLTTTATACGSFTITASCPACSTTATKDVRVTDGGRWVDVSWCDECPGCRGQCGGPCESTIVGNHRNIVFYFNDSHPAAEPHPGICEGYLSGCPSVMCHWSYGCTRYRRILTQEWQCQ
ncbi:MAG: hypothetical protein HZA11_09120 [Nitrospirae bacterium]|nr:hypothetical protein [Nitrospirota bacterium]